MLVLFTILNLNPITCVYMDWIICITIDKKDGRIYLIEKKNAKYDNSQLIISSLLDHTLKTAQKICIADITKKL